MPSRITVIVGLASGAVSTGLTKVKAQFSQFRHDLQGELGSFLAFGGIIAGLEAMIQKATEISNISRRFGAPAQELQRVTNAGRENGAQIEDVARSWNKLAVNQQKAIAGNDEMRKAFEKLGIPMQDVARMTVDQLFYRVADATASAEDRGKAYAAVVQIMGRNAGLLYTTLEKGSGKIKEQGDEIGIMSDKAIESLHKMHVQIERLKNTIFIYGGSIIVFFQKILETIGAFVGETVNEVELLVNVFKQAAAVSIQFVSGLAKGKIQIDTTSFLNAVEDVKKNAGAIGKILGGIWKPDSSGEHEGGNKKPLDVEIDPTEKENAAAEKLLSLRARLAEIQRQTANDELDTQQKINALVAQRTALLKEAAGTKDEEKKLNLQIDAANVTKEILAAQQEADRAAERAAREQLREMDLRDKIESQVPKISSNSLRRIGGQESGGFAVAGVDNKLLAEQTKHTKLLEDIKKNTEDAGQPLIMQ